MNFPPGSLHSTIKGKICLLKKVVHGLNQPPRVYMNFHSDCLHSTRKGKVFRLKKALYELKQSPKALLRDLIGQCSRMGLDNAKLITLFLTSINREK